MSMIAAAHLRPGDLITDDLGPPLYVLTAYRRARVGTQWVVKLEESPRTLPSNRFPNNVGADSTIPLNRRQWRAFGLGELVKVVNR